MPDNTTLRNDKNIKAKILIVHNHYQIPGGEDTVVENEKKLLEENGHEVVLYTRNNNEIKTMSRLKKLLLPIMTVCNPRSARDVKRIIKSEGIDIVHVHNTLNLISPSVYYAAVTCGVPVVQTIHNFRFICPGAALYRDGHICEDCIQKGLSCAIKHGCYRNSKAQTLILVISVLLHKAAGIYGKLNYICLTGFNREKLLTLNGKREVIPPSQVFVKPNFTFSPPSGMQKRRDGQDGPMSFIYVGRLDELKGIQTLFEAWSLMGEEAPLLRVCGSGPMQDWCVQRSQGLHVEMKGFLDSASVNQLIADSRALIMPTLWYEGFGMTVIEAFSCGVPVICSDLGNAGSLVEEGVTGWKFRPGDAQALAQAVRKAMGDGSGVRDNARRVFAEKYSPEANYRRLEEIYMEVRHANRSAGSQRRKFRK